MKRKLLAGTTGLKLRVFVQDSSMTDGSGLAGLTSASAGLTWYYARNGGTSATAVTLAAGTLGTWSPGGFVAVDGVNMPGVYEVGVPDAAIAAGSDTVHMMLRGATNMVPVLVEVELDLINYQDSARAGLTALPNAAAGATGGLPTANSAGAVAANVTEWGGVAVATPALAGVPVVDVHYSAGQANVATAQAGTSTTITLSTDEPIADNLFVNQYIGIIGGTGAGQARMISGYSGPGRLATVSRAWDQTPDSTSVYAIGGLGEVATVTGPVALDMTQAVPISNTVQTVGDALNAARAQGFGRWTIAGTTLTLYAADGTTVVRSFALDSATSPTSRS